MMFAVNSKNANNINILNQINDIKNWKKTHKKQYMIYMCKPIIGTTCRNDLEGTVYRVDTNDQFILSGTVGENWVIRLDKLIKTYTFSDGTPITVEALKKKCDINGQIDWTLIKTRSDATYNWAFFLPKNITNFPVQTSWGDKLLANRQGIKHGLGDFLVCSDNCGYPNLADMWVVNGEIFPKTYDMRAFPDIAGRVSLTALTAKPTKSFMMKAVPELNNGIGIKFQQEIYTNYLADKVTYTSSYIYFVKQNPKDGKLWIIRSPSGKDMWKPVCPISEEAHVKMYGTR